MHHKLKEVTEVELAAVAGGTQKGTLPQSYPLPGLQELIDRLTNILTPTQPLPTGNDYQL